MSKGIGKRVALSVTAAVIAVTAAIAVGAIGTEPASAGWCAYTDANGELAYADVPSKIALPRSGVKVCEEDFDGEFITNNQYDRINNRTENFSGLLPVQHPVSDFPPGWFESLGPCNEVLVSTGQKLPNTVGVNNRIVDVYRAQTTELAVQIAYDIGSNELTGILGAVLGSILGVVKVPTFTMEWKYDVQDECQEIVERNTIQSINVDTQSLVIDVQTILSNVDVAVSTRATQTSVDAVDAKVMQISTTLGALGASLTTETDEIDAALAALAASLTAETDEIDAALAALSLQLAAAQDQSVRLYIEDHLESCREIAGLLLADAPADAPDGLLPLTVVVVGDLADRAEAAGWNIGNARQHMANADSAIAAGDAGKGFQSLCTAYGKIVNAP